MAELNLQQSACSLMWQITIKYLQKWNITVESQTSFYFLIVCEYVYVCIINKYVYEMLILLQLYVYSLLKNVVGIEPRDFAKHFTTE